MKTFTMMGPSGRMTTSATSESKARSNFRYRLVHECGMSWYAARDYDMSDLKEVTK